MAKKKRKNSKPKGEVPEELKRRRDPKITEIEREVIMDMVLQGFRTNEIAEALGVHASRVSKVKESGRIAHVDRFAWKYEERLAQQLRRIDLLEKEAWESWQKSKKPETTITEDYYEEDGDGEESPNVTLKRVIKSSNGDPRFLAIISRCIDQRSKLLKLDKFEGDGNADDGPIDLKNVPIVIFDVGTDREELERVQSIEALKQVESARDELEKTGE